MSRPPFGSRRWLHAITCCGLLCGGAMAQSSEPSSSVEAPSSWNPTVGGYLRQYVGINTRNHQSTGAGALAPQAGLFQTNCAPGAVCADYDDRGKLSMLRTQLRLNFAVGPDHARLRGVARAAYEHETGFLRELERRGAQPGFVQEQLTGSELRELYLDLSPSRDIAVRFGKQQIVWEEADVPILDTIHGLDLRWRGTGELGETEEFRKPLVALLGTFAFPRIDAKVDAFVRPGWDEDDDIGSSPDNYGGRWTFNFAEGVDNRASFRRNPDHPDGRFDGVTGGVRWSQQLGSVSYSLMAFTTFADPVANPCLSFRPPVAALGGRSLAELGAESYGRPARCAAGGGGVIGDYVLKIVPVLGVTVNLPVESLGAIVTAVAGYSRKVPFTRGVVPVVLGVGEKDVLRWSARIERPIDLGFLGAWRSSAMSLQLSGTHVLRLDPQQGLVQNVIFPARLRREAYAVSARLDLPFQNDIVVASLAASYDLSYGGGSFSPQVEVLMAKSWRLRVQYDRFLAPNARIAPVGNPVNQAVSDANVLSSLDRKDQLTLRLTYQF